MFVQAYLVHVHNSDIIVIMITSYEQAPAFEEMIFSGLKQVSYDRFQACEVEKTCSNLQHFTEKGALG